MEIGKAIRALRQRDSITQEALAWQLGVTPQAVSRWENGQALPDIALLPAIARIFGVTTDALLAYDPEAHQREVAAVQREFYRRMDTEPNTAVEILRQGLQKFLGNEALLADSLYLLRGAEHYEERAALCRRLQKSRHPKIRFRALCALAKAHRDQGHDLLARELLDELPEYDYTALELRALLLSGEDSFSAAQREKTASLSRLLEMLRVLALRYQERGQSAEAETMARIALNVLEAFRPDVPYQFPANDAKTQTYDAFQPEREALAKLAQALACSS